MMRVLLLLLLFLLTCGVVISISEHLDMACILALVQAQNVQVVKKKKGTSLFRCDGNIHQLRINDTKLEMTWLLMFTHFQKSQIHLFISHQRLEIPTIKFKCFNYNILNFSNNCKKI